MHEVNMKCSVVLETWDSSGTQRKRKPLEAVTRRLMKTEETSVCECVCVKQ
jgi:hypothetical protein